MGPTLIRFCLSLFFVLSAASFAQADDASLRGLPQFVVAKANAANNLIGSWQCAGESGLVPLIFHSANQLEFNGSGALYTLVPGAIRVQEDRGIVDYPYALKGGSLIITFPGGALVRCTKSAAQKETGKATGGQEHLLRGKLCSWSGSSTNTSSYASTRWAYFDGRGGFSYGSESQFSSQAGGYYGSPGSNSGRYRVSGNTVTLSFSDGSTDSASVHHRNGDGSIAELKYNGKIYAAAMCQ